MTLYIIQDRDQWQPHTSCGRCWASAKKLHEKRTAVNKKYQNSISDTPGAHSLTVPEHVTVAMAQIAGACARACWLA